MAKKIEIEITGDTKGLERALTNAQKTSQGFGKGLATAAKGATVALGVLGVGAVFAVKKASDLGEQLNKVAVVFRGSETQIIKWSKSTASAFGISQRAALEAAGTFGNMLVPMGIARDTAGKMSTRFVELAADMASFNNASPEETLDALRAGLAGETEPLRRFGVFLNQARIEQEAMNMGLTKGKAPLTAQQKAMATYSIILKDTSDTQGDFGRTSDSLANQQRILQAQLEDTAAALGTALLPAATAAAGVMLKLVNVTREHDTAAKASVATVGALSGAIILANASLKIYNASLVVALGTTRALRIALAATPWVAVGIAVGAFAAYLISQKDEATAASKALDDLTQATRDYNNALKDGKKARRELKTANLEVEATEIAVRDAQRASKEIHKDANATLDERRTAEINVARAMDAKRSALERADAAQMASTGEGIKATNAAFRQRNAFDELAKLMQGRFAAANRDAATTTRTAARQVANMSARTAEGKATVAEYADAVRELAAALPNAAKQLRNTANMAALLADAWGRVVSLPQARSFVARFSVITTVETKRQRPSGALGGVVQRGGAAIIHSGERIVPARIARGGQGNGNGGGSWQLALVAIGPDLARELQQVNTKYARGNGGRSLW